MPTARYVLPATFAALLSGCGTRVPSITENPTATPELLVEAIVHSIHCEVRNAIIKELGSTKYPEKYKPKPYMDFMDDWGAEVALTLTIDEKSTLSPNGLWMPSKIFNLSSGISGTSDAQRTEKMNWFYTFADLRNGVPCDTVESPHPVGSLLIQSDLKLDEWISSEALAVATNEIASPSSSQNQSTTVTPATAGATPPPAGTQPKAVTPAATQAATGVTPNVISHEVTFDITTSGNVAPIWKLVRATVNGSGSLFAASRDRKHDLLITLGPIDHSNPSPNAPPALIPQAEASHAAQQTGLFTATGVVNSTPP